MVVQSRRRTARRTRRALTSLAVAGAAFAGFAGSAQAAVGTPEVAPIPLPGSNNDGKTCAELVPGSTELRFNSGAVGTHTVSDGTFSVTLKIPSQYDTNGGNDSLDFVAANGTLVQGVIVKGGSEQSTFYDYRPLGGVTFDELLRTQSGGGISHVNFCVVPGGPPPAASLTVSKDAAPSFDRSFTWTIDKSTPTTQFTQPGGTVSVTYTVVADRSDGTESGHVVSGTITVGNPNNGDVSGVTIADGLNDPNATCAVVNGTNVTVPANGTVTRTYSCTFTATPATTGTNTATVTWPAQTLSDGSALAAGSDTGTATYDFGSALVNELNECATVTDTFNGGTPVVLGTPCGDATYTPTAVITVKPGCHAYTNVAVVTPNDGGTPDDDSVTVTVCGPNPTGARTMGFWQNKNGQGIIKSDTSTAGECDLTDWLRQFAPFQDLADGSSCAQVAAYVYAVIKAATAGGDTMNKMLKAQMLATALDVYFSDPALGGNKIGATGPIGSQVVDLNMVCTDQSCTTFEDVGAAFGGADSATVMQLLQYAASQSNAGGTSWYGQSKGLQELAKDTFDAINNDLTV